MCKEVQRKIRAAGGDAKEVNIHRKYHKVEKVEPRPKYKNYLSKLSNSKTLKRDKKEWENIMENKSIKKVQDRYEILRAELERKDKEIELME